MNDWSLLEIGGAGGYIKVVFEQTHAKEHVDIEVIYSRSGKLKGLVIIE